MAGRCIGREPMSTDEFQSAGGTVVHRNETVYEEQAMVDRYDSFGDDGWLTERQAAIVDEYFAEPGRVLDVGCGTGRTTRPLADGATTSSAST